MEIKFNSDDDPPLEKTLEFQVTTMGFEPTTT